MWIHVLGSTFVAALGGAAFEANVGQAPAEVSHLVRGDREVAFVTLDGFVLSVPTEDGFASVRARWRGAAEQPARGTGPLQGDFYYFIDGPQGRRAARHRGLTASEVYPGIDLEYALGDTLRFGFVVAPGANVGAIQLDLDADVELRVEPRAAEIDVLDDQAAGRVMTVRLARLRAWQEGPFAELDVRFVPRGGGLGFALGPHDPARPVYIDPDITYASYIGSTNLDEAREVAVDASGMVYVAGRTQNPGTLFPTTSGALQPAPPGSFDAFVLKVDPSQTGASSLVYGSFLGGQFDDFGESVDVDASGRVIVGGTTNFFGGNTFPTTTNAYSRTPESSFVSILNAAGSQLVYSTFLGSVGTAVTSVHAAPSGSFIAAGSAGSNGVIPLVNNIPVTAASSGFVLEFDLTRTGAASVVYGTRIEGPNVRNAAVDASGVYLLGTSGSNLATTPGAAQGTFGGGTDYFVTKVDTNRLGAAAVRYTTYLGGADVEGNVVYYDGIAVDGAGAAYVTGLTGAQFPTTTGSFASTPPGGGEGFLTKIHPTGQSFEFSTYLGGTGNDGGYDVAVDATGRAWVAGFGNGLPVSACRPASVGGGYVVQFDAQGQRLEQATYLSATGDVRPYGIAVGPNGRVYTAGSAIPTGPLTSIPGAFQTVQSGADGFVAELEPAGPCADLDVTLAVTPSPVVGPAPAQLQVFLQNLGSAEVATATASAFVPPELGVRAVSPASCTGGPTYTCHIGRLGVSATATVTFDIEATAAGTFTATAAVSAPVQDPDPSNDFDQLNVFVTSPTNPCGFVTLFGSCTGDTLSFCEDRGRPAERLTQVNCRTEAFPAGVPGECTLVNPTYGHDCAVSPGGDCAFVDDQDRPIFALCAGDRAGCRIDPSAGTATCQTDLPSCASSGFDAQCAEDLLFVECQVDQPVALDCAAVGGECRNARCVGLPLGAPCEEDRLECAPGLVCDAVSEVCEDPAARCDPTTYRSDCAGDVLTACDGSRDRVVSIDCNEAFVPSDGTACGEPFSCGGRSCGRVNVTCVGGREGARCDLAREIYCGPGLGCVLASAPDGSIASTCRPTPTCTASDAPACAGGVAPVCLGDEELVVVEAQGVDCASFGSACAAEGDASVCVGGPGAICQVVGRGGSILRCESGSTCEDVNRDGFGTCRSSTGGADAGTVPDGDAALDAGTPSRSDAGTSPSPGRTNEGGGCRCAPSSGPAAWSGWVALVLPLLMRRARSPRALRS